MIVLEQLDAPVVQQAGFWMSLAVWWIASIASYALRPRPKIPVRPPAGISDFDLPTVDETRPVPIVVGTCLLRAPNVLWYGDLEARPLKAYQGWITGGQLVAAPDNPGFKYYLTLQWGLCMGPIDEITQIRFDDKVAAQGSAVTVGDRKQITIDKPEFFGGEAKEGGVVGTFDIHLGGATQAANDWLPGAIGVGAVPAYRGLCYAVARHVYFGTTEYLKPIAFEVRRCPNQLGLTGGKHNIAGDANPAAWLYEILTDATWGLGISTTAIDTASFLAAGDTLATETMGISMLVDQLTTAEDLIGDVLQHIDGVLYVEPNTGLFTLKLVRADYTLAGLPQFNDSNCKVVRFSRPADGELVNQVRVTYLDRAKNYEERVAQAHDLAGLQRAGETVSEQLEFRGFSTAANGQRAASRSLKALAYPGAVAELEMNREAHALRPGAVFRWSSARLGITDMVLRVRQLHGGELEDGRILVDALEDIYAITWTAYAPPGTTTWTNPIAAPVALAAQRLVEAPYALVDNDTGVAHRRVMTLGSRGAAIALGYKVWSDPNGGTSYLETADVPALTPSGTLTAAISSYTATSLTVGSGIDVTALASITAAELAAGHNLLLVGDEWMAWQTVTNNGDGTYTISGIVRGVLDSTPKTHSSGARVWFVTNGAGVTSAADYGADLTLTAKLLPYNTLGTLAIGSATQLSITTASRAARPYVPRDVKLNTVLYPASISGELTVSWTHRNRLAAWEYDDGGTTSGPESTYTVRLYGQDGLLKRTVTGLTGTSYTWSTEAADSGGSLNTQVRVVVVAVNAFGESAQAYDYTVARV